MKKISFLLILLSLLISNLGFCEEESNNIIAIIGRTVITEYDLSVQIMSYVQQLPENQRQNINLAEMKGQFLQEIVNRKTMEQYAKKEGYEIDREKVNQQIEGILNNTRKQFSSEQEFLLALSQSGMTLDDLKKKYKEQIEEDLLVQQVVSKEIRSNVEVKNSDIEKFFNENKNDFQTIGEAYELSQILLRVRASNEEIQKLTNKLNQIKEELSLGKSFSELAKIYSEGPTSVKGGDLGYFKKGDMVPEFDNVAFKLKVNEVSDIVETQFGLHLIKVTEKREDQVRASHILLQPNITKEDTLRTLELAEKLKKEIDNNKIEFNNAVKQFSYDLSSKEESGYMGKFTQSNLNPAIYEAIKDKKKNDISIVQTPMGIHLIKILNKKTGSEIELYDVKDQIEKIVQQQKTTEAIAKWIEDKQKSEIYVKIFWERL